MKIVALNESVVANSTPNRLKEALDAMGQNVEFVILTRHRNVNTNNVKQLKYNYILKIVMKMEHMWNKLIERVFFEKKYGFPFSYARYGYDFSKNKDVLDADIIQIHWVGSGFLTPGNLKKIIKLNKPVIFVCHDNGIFTGGCHVKMECEEYMRACGRCPQLNSNIKKDWSYKQLKRRIKAVDIKKKNIYVISPSNWMDSNVANSAMLRDKNHIVIPNPTNTSVFLKKDKKILRKKLGIDNNKKVILFGAVNATKVPYKGYEYLIKSLEIFLDKVTSSNQEFVLVVFGAKKEEAYIRDRIETIFLGRLNIEEMSNAYNIADVYVVPSLEDSFNNTVAESLSCETPVVAFATGGIPDIIDHKINGYLAERKNISDLAEGIKWVLENNEKNRLGENGRMKVIKQFSYDAVASHYLEIYNQIL